MTSYFQSDVLCLLPILRVDICSSFSHANFLVLFHWPWIMLVSYDKQSRLAQFSVFILLELYLQCKWFSLYGSQWHPVLWFWKLSPWMPSLLMSLFLSSSKKEYTLLHDVTVRGIMKTPLWLQRDVFRSVRHYSRSLGIGQWPALKQYCNMKTGQVWQAFQESPQINEGIYTRIGSWPLAGIDSWRWSSNSYIQRGTLSNRRVAIMLTL